MSAGRAPFPRAAVAALVVGGFALFLALLAIMARGEAPLAAAQDGTAHGAANGLNGYSGLVRLLSAQGFDVTRSRSPRGLERRNLVVLTPPHDVDPEKLGALLEQRRRLGPTLVILPKWRAGPPPANLPREEAAKWRHGWVALRGASAARWTADLPAPFTLSHRIHSPEGGLLPRWSGLGQQGALPTRSVAHALPDPSAEAVLRDDNGRTLVLRAGRAPMGASANYPVLFVAEPDLVNNYGMADPARAALAIELVQKINNGGRGEITFDLTLNGFGGSENLLTLAFRPPFLAATLCLMLALGIVFWRAMLRFGPVAAAEPSAGFAKQQLVANSAGLILRARRWGLLAAPYARLAERRLAKSLGLTRPDPAAIDAALAVRLPDDEPFTPRAARLAAARTPTEILSAAQALETLHRKLKR
jgi:hypothetical protein